MNGIITKDENYSIDNGQKIKHLKNDIFTSLKEVKLSRSLIAVAFDEVLKNIDDYQECDASWWQGYSLWVSRKASPSGETLG